MTSSTSAVSTRSDTTLVHEDDTETIVDEEEKGRTRGFSTADSIDEGEGGGGREGEERRERKSTLTREGGKVKGTKEEGEGEEGGGEDRKDGRSVEEEAREEKEEEEKEEVFRYQMSVMFRQELLKTLHLKVDSRLGLEIAKLSDSNGDLVQLLGRCLPHIVPNVILAKREVRGREGREGREGGQWKKGNRRKGGKNHDNIQWASLHYMSFKLSIFLLSIVCIQFCNLVLVVYFIMGQLGHWVSRESWAHKRLSNLPPQVSRLGTQGPAFLFFCFVCCVFCALHCMCT